MSDPLAGFSEPTRAWFAQAFEAPTAAQAAAWEAVAAGDNALVIAPTGSGKTLAGFLWSLDRLMTAPRPGHRVTAGRPADGRRAQPDDGRAQPDDGRLKVVYVSPLKALAADIERNLRSPLHGISAAAARLGTPVRALDVAMRTGDTPPEDRRRFAKSPPDILITTPESLFLILTSQARQALRSVDTVIVDEVHALAGNKRGAHLALSLERLDHLTGRPAQRLGLSATVRPPEEVAGFLGGARPVTIVDRARGKRLEVSVVVPVQDMAALDQTDADELSPVEERTSIWPHVEERVLQLILAHSSTIVFVNSRRLSERLCARLNELAEKEVARSHHGSVSKEQRKQIEEDLKAGRLPCVVATSSLELGIDMALVDLVVQVEAPPSVASGLQRIGRAGHRVDEVSRGVVFPKFRGDLLQSAVVAERMRTGAIEEMRYPRNPLDVLAQQIVAMVAMESWTVDELEQVITRAAPFHDLPRAALEEVLDMLSGRYPSVDFADLRPRLDWDRLDNILTARPNAQSLAVISGGTIPDRGLFGVFMVGEQQTRVGELDEEMVYESRPGDVFVLGASSWLIEDITADRVLVSPAPGQPGKMPFWHGDAPGRPVELGKAIGAFVRELGSLPPDRQLDRLEQAGLDGFAASNLVAYLQEQKDASGALPDDRTIVVERFRDEIGDWRLCIHSLFGAPVNAPWAQAIEAKLRAELGFEAQCIHTDDGIIVRLPEADESPAANLIAFEPEDIEEEVVERVGSSSLFSSRFRECASRALLLPRRRPGRRTPLWQQRQKSAHLLEVAARHPSFPIRLETYRETLQDVFDLPALKALMSSIRRREVRIVEVDSPYPSPFAGSLQFGYVAAFMYEGDVPLAERRAQALSLDRSLLAEIMGHDELRELIDEEALHQLELDLQRLSAARKAKSERDLQDMLRALGDLSTDELRARCEPASGVETWLRELEAGRRIVGLRVAGQLRWIAAEDAARYRDALGAALPMGLPQAFLEPVADPLTDLVARYAATHGPFVAGDVAQRLGLGPAVVTGVLRALLQDKRVVMGEFRPARSGREWIDVEVLRRLRRRSLAAFRRDVEPVAHDVYARFCLAWHSIDAGGRLDASPASIYDVVEQLQGAPIPASTLETQVFPARLVGYRAGMLDELCASGDVVWAGAGALGSDDGWVCLAVADKADALLPRPTADALSPMAQAVLDALRASGAVFYRQLQSALGATEDEPLIDALWDLVWAGYVTNDTLAPVRALAGGRRRRTSTPGRGRRPMPSRMGPPTAVGRWSALQPVGVDDTRRMTAVAQQLLARHGIVTRGALNAESLTGGFAGVYPIFKAMEESGRCRRGYFIDGLGGAQFASPGAVDRMRALADAGDSEQSSTRVLSATDPANPYGAALPWPERGEGGHRPGRKAGALVVLVAGELVLYVEKGGRTLLTFTDDSARLQPAIDALVLAFRDGLLGGIALEKADGEPVMDTPFADALLDAGFKLTSRGLRLRA